MKNGFESIAGYEYEKKELINLRKMLHHAEVYRSLGLRIPRGLVLAGAPGIGKTVLAKAIADDGISTVEFRSAESDTERAENELHKAFCRAKENAPSVLLLDDLDKIAGMTFFTVDTGAKLRKYLLHELDDLRDDESVLVVATCNDPDTLGSVLLRPGRFDRVIRMDMPDEGTRRKILCKYLRKLRLMKDVDLDGLARATCGFSGAMLECLVNDAGIMAMEKNRRFVTEADFRKAMNAMTFSGGEKLPSTDPEELRKTVVHEAGHALVALKLWPECLNSASVVPQGYTSGHVDFVPEESSSPNLDLLEKRVAVLLAGRVAERTVLGCCYAGSVSDVRSAVNSLYILAMDLAAYGYSYVLHPCSGHEEVTPSETSKHRVESKVEERLNAMDALAEQTILDNRALFDAICDALTERKQLSRRELIELAKKFSENANDAAA